MKVLMVLDREFPPDLRVENEIEALSVKGKEIHLACFTRTGLPLFEQKDNVAIHRRPISKLTYKSSVAALTFRRYFTFWQDYLEELGSSEHFDLIHIHDLPLVGTGVAFATRHNIPVIADLHENWPAYLRTARHTRTFAGKLLSPNHKWVKYERDILKTVNHIIVVVEEAKHRLTALGLEPEKITVVSNTLNIAHADIPEKTGKNNPPVLFYAGGIHFHRGLQTVIRAMALTKMKKYRMIALGEGSYRASLINLAQSLGLQDTVSFPGWKPYKEMLQWMGKSDFALIPHIKSEHTDSTMPHKLFQYMYAGIPVIASDCVPLKRILEETGAGLIFPSEDHVKLAEILDNMDVNHSETWSKNGKKWVEKKYNWKQDSMNLTNLYNKYNKRLH